MLNLNFYFFIVQIPHSLGVQSRMDYTVLSQKEVEDLRNSLGLARIP